MIIKAFIVLSIAIILVLLLINLLISPSNPDIEKISPYECGYAPFHGQTRAPFTVQYYLVGLLFLAFDLEIIMLLPLGAEVASLSVYNYYIITVFYAVLTIGFVFELGKGALEFTSLKAALE